MALGQARGRRIAVTGGEDGTLRVWDVASGALYDEYAPDDCGQIYSIGLVANQGDVTIAVGDSTGSVWTVDLVDGRRNVDERSDRRVAEFPTEARRAPRRRVQFWALLEPSRMEIPLYRDHLRDAQMAAEAVNRRFERPGWRPIWLSLDHGRPTVLAALQQFDCLLVNARRDGMNLVAKEGALINRRKGTIALSTAAGAHHELQGAVVSIEPTDELDTARALHRRLVMPPAERERRALLAADRVGSRSIDTWLSELIGDLEFRGRA